jgi:8-oxo-dGTP pyrophosphatase MutT (NUDIX family)
MAIADAKIKEVVDGYLARHPEEAVLLTEALQHLHTGEGLASRHTLPMHVTVGALVLRGDEVLLVEHLAYGIWLQPGGHLEPTDTSLIDAAVRESTEESGIDPVQIRPASPLPVYVEYGQVPARPEKNEPAHFHLDIGFAFTAAAGTPVGRVQESEVAAAAWYPLAQAERLVGSRIARATMAPK